jgi:hypothetical protein
VPPADHRLTYGSTPLEFGELRLKTGFDSGSIWHSGDLQLFTARA